MKSGEGKYQIQLTAELVSDSVEPREVAEAAEQGQEVRRTWPQGHGSQLRTFISTGPSTP